MDYNADHSHLLTEANLLKHEHLLEVASLRLNKGVCHYVKDGRKGFLGARKFAQVDRWLTEVEAERRAGQGQAKAPRFRSASQLVPKDASLFQVFPLHSWSGNEGVKALEPARKAEMLTVKSLCTSILRHKRALASYSQVSLEARFYKLGTQNQGVAKSMPQSDAIRWVLPSPRLCPKTRPCLEVESRWKTNLPELSKGTSTAAAAAILKYTNTGKKLTRAIPPKASFRELFILM